MKILSALFVLALLCSSGGISANINAAYHSHEEDAVLEVVFRYQLANCYKRRSPKVYFLARGVEELSDEFMERFKDHTPPVRKRSQMTSEFRDKETGVQGVILGVKSIKQLDELRFEIEGYCAAGGLDGYGYVYEVVQVEGQWKIKNVRETWIS